jgi:hypothetical protein
MIDQRAIGESAMMKKKRKKEYKYKPPFRVKYEVSIPIEDGWTLCLQYGRQFYEPGQGNDGYRFYCRLPNGKPEWLFTPVPTLRMMEELIDLVKKTDWWEKFEASG